MTTRGPGLGAHGRQRVLVVDPDREAGAETGDLLQELGYAVEVARDGFEALSALSRSPPVLIVVDQSLGGKLDAGALIARVRKLRDVKDVAVVATASEPSADGVQDRLRASGVRVFVDKLMSRGGMSSAIRVAMGKEPAVTQPAKERPRARPSPRQRGPRNTVPSARAPAPAMGTATVTTSSPTTGSMVSVAGFNEVDCWLEWDEHRESCVLEKASPERVIVRCPGRVPSERLAVRLTVPLRAVIQDAMRDVPVRILGEVTASQPLAGGARLKIVIKAARPDGNFRKLRSYLARSRS